MKIKILILLVSIMGCLTAYSQTIDEAQKALKKIKKIEDYDKLKKQYPKWNIYVLQPLLSDSVDFPDIINSKVGDIIRRKDIPDKPKFVLKVMQIENVELCKLKYIFLSGDKYSKKEVDSLRTTILRRYALGTDFDKLVQEYTMDGNPTGELDWFKKGIMVEEFENAVWNRTKDEIFSVDVDSKKWYYVVLKNYDNKTEKSFKSIMIRYNDK